MLVLRIETCNVLKFNDLRFVWIQILSRLVV
jgi:hypothetical protein